MNALDAVIHALSSRQLGLITRADVRRAGGTDKYIRHALERGWWQELQAGVYLTGSAPPTWLQRQLAACLAIGPEAVTSHRAAVALRRLDGGYESLVELSVALDRCPKPANAILHRTKRWDPIDRTVYRGVPVTSVNRTLIDYGAVAPRLLVERAVEDAFNRRLTTEGALRRRLAQVGGRGCRGAGVLRWVLDNRPTGKPARSGFEVIVGDVFRQFGMLDLFVRNHEVPNANGRIVAEIDFARPIEKFGVEADGAKWHSTRRAHLRDVERQEMLEAMGWTFARGTWDEVIHHPERFVAHVRSLLCSLSAV
jgi:hypothetical protein